MAKIYFRKIINGQMELADVPEKWREQVKTLLQDAGYDLAGQDGQADQSDQSDA